MIGRIVECDGEQIIQTLAGATAGTVCKVGYDSNQDYALPLVLNELGEGYVGISSDATICGPTYNPTTGVLKACCVEAESSNAVGACNVLANGSNASTNYNLAFWTSTADGCYCPMGFSSGYAITYNPSTATLTSCCGSFTDCVTTKDLLVDTATVRSTVALIGNVNIENDHGSYYGSINSGKLNWEGGAWFLTRPVCINSLCIGTTVENPSGCFLLRTDSGTVSYDSALTLANGTVAINTGLSVSCAASFNSDACGYGWYITPNGTACFNSSVTACGGFVGNASSSTITDSLGYTGGWGVCEVRAVSTPVEFEGQCGWANYLLFSHGDGATYYGQAIRMPFWSVPQYFRRENGVVHGWYDFITSENISSQTVGTANVLNTDNTATVRAECNNELNLYPSVGCVAWLNYRGGASETWIGNGGATGGKGILCAANIYGEYCVYSNGSPTVTAACFNCCLRDCGVPRICLSGNTVVICTRS